MSGLTLFTFMLIAICCYAVSGKSSLRNEHQQQLLQQQHQATKKVDLPNRHIPSLEQYRAEQQISHALNEENRQKRSQHDLGEYKDLNDLIDELQDNSIIQAAGLPVEFDLESMPPLTYYLLLQKLKQLQSTEPMYRVRTPRLGRSIDFQLEDSDDEDDVHNNKQQFLTQLMKKSVPFKPRLGKRAQVCV